MVVPLDQRPRSGPYSGLNYRSAKRFLARQFEAAHLPFSDEDALDLLLGLTGLSQTDYVLRGTEFITTDEFETLRDAADRRLAGEPVDRILGYRDFYGRRFTIQSVLSPRGDTEVLLMAALKAIDNLTSPTILELGTGSGALAISCLCERPDATALATDIDRAALKTAQQNAATHKVCDRLGVLRSDWFQSVPNQTFDLIISNPPYISDQAMEQLDREVAAHDPHLALSGGADGLDPYRILVPTSASYLKPGGCLAVEIGFDQAAAVQDLFSNSGFHNPQCLTDPAGRDRVIIGQMQS